MSGRGQNNVPYKKLGDLVISRNITLQLLLTTFKLKVCTSHLLSLTLESLYWYHIRFILNIWSTDMRDLGLLTFWIINTACENVQDESGRSFNYRNGTEQTCLYGNQNLKEYFIIYKIQSKATREPTCIKQQLIQFQGREYQDINLTPTGKVKKNQSFLLW